MSRFSFVVLPSELRRTNSPPPSLSSSGTPRTNPHTPKLIPPIVISEVSEMATGDDDSQTSRPRASERTSARRRQVRKGTRSCWGCRRRKIRCVFNVQAVDICRTCWDKGTPCVGQEFPEDEAPPNRVTVGSVGGRLGRMERLVEQLYHRASPGRSPAPLADSQGTFEEALSLESSKEVAGGGEGMVDDDDGLVTCGNPSPGNRDTSTLQLPAATTTQQTVASQHNSSQPQVNLHRATRTHPLPALNPHLSTLTRDLTAMLPSPEERQGINRLYSNVEHVFQLLLTRHDALEKLQPESVEHFVDGLYEPMHPVLLVKRMLTLATTLQRIPAPTSRDSSSAAVSPRHILEQLAETAISLVCENNRLMGSIDALQCIILQVAYLANGGNLRLSLLACRRAISVAQLMGIHRPHDASAIETLDPGVPVDTHFIWFRIVYLERFICLLLGLPESTHAHHSTPQFDGTLLALLDSHPFIRLEYVHSVVASKIIQRNQHDSIHAMRNVTRALDLELQTVADTMPRRWWTIPRFGNKTDVDDSLRLCCQVFHHFLLIQLHLPFMLQPSTEASSSRTACTDASRAVLSRFVAIRSAGDVCSTPDAADFFALIAGMTLLLAHVDARRRGREGDVLAHQRHTDRDKVEETLELMGEASSASTDVMSMRSADVLRRLLDIEERAARGSKFIASLTSSSVSTPCENHSGGLGEDASDVLQLKIPYYGTVTISPDALPTREPLRSRTELQGLAVQGQQGEMIGASRAPPIVDAAPMVNGMVGCDGGLLGDSVNTEPWIVDDARFRDVGPGFSARVEDWAFQGVDAAFFDSMIRGFEDTGEAC
ncbi:hypothetical protein CPLU01_14898 [Colletotrichum plurivorum]|uniref:Zn(2)-C6 fungal-type domain-containing protein n=1 Tax=Colletotrichum plurivorum TaxID=2175906 RepID=A0A8H6JG93_9PEZI|nr:hypothetical protein CPLU01_14898 [Colletotrichum plurivorum]